jgi:hypothetical protein
MVLASATMAHLQFSCRTASVPFGRKILLCGGGGFLIRLGHTECGLEEYPKKIYSFEKILKRLSSSTSLHDHLLPSSSYLTNGLSL